MSNRKRAILQLLGVVVFSGIVTLHTHIASAQKPLVATHDTTSVFNVNGRIALHALMSLSDAHLQKLADVFTLLATSDAARSGKWELIKEPLAQAAKMNVPAVYWFAKPDGTYWTVDGGLASAKLSDRAYFPPLMAGKTVLGDLVVSRSSKRNTAIVAVPVRGPNKKVVGALGCSVHLDSLAALIQKQMGGLEKGLIFFAINNKPLGALNSDSSLIFTDPMQLGEEDMKQAFRTMLAGAQGVVSYNFHGSHRTVLYQKSPVTNWWYGFGIIEK